MATQLVAKRLIPTVSNIGARYLSVDAETAKQIGAYADPAEHMMGRERKIWFARMAGDDRYEPKVYRRGPGTQDVPNLVPTVGPNRLVACVCEPGALHLNLMWIRKGSPKRCECGYWFKAVDADPDAVV